MLAIGAVARAVGRVDLCGALALGLNASALRNASVSDPELPSGCFITAQPGGGAVVTGALHI